ncbi:hypothetical protein V1282_004351 [Nitrobacteraceae bacterium AZCC 2146]
MVEREAFTRQEFYDLVWSTAMTKLAKRFGMSDVGLRKICVKHGIPTPPAGYWAKLEFGKKVSTIPLLAAAAGVSDRVVVSVHAVVELPEAVVTAQLAAEEKMSDAIVVPAELPSRLHQVASATRQALKAAKADHEQFLKTELGPGVVSAQVGKPSAQRVVLIVDTIARTLERLGHATADAKDGADLIIDGESLRLLFHETKDKSEHHPTAAELAEQAKWEERRKQWPTLYNADRRHWRSWDYSPSGRLSLTLVSPVWTSWSSDRILGRWHDRKAATVEQQLNEVVVAMYAGVALLKHNRAKLEERQRLHQEEMDRRERERDRQDRIAKREAFVRLKAKEHAELVELRSFSRHLDGETVGLDMPNAAAIAGVARDMVDRLEFSLSGSALDKEIERLKLYLDGDLAEEA